MKLSQTTARTGKMKSQHREATLSVFTLCIVKAQDKPRLNILEQVIALSSTELTHIVHLFTSVPYLIVMICQGRGCRVMVLNLLSTLSAATSK